MGFQSVFKAAFPFISAAASLGGPLGTMAASAVGKAIGIDSVSPDAVPDAIAAATSKDPEMMLKLKQVEHDFALQMQALGFKQVDDLLNMDAADRASARAREIAVRDHTPMILAFVVVVMTILAEGYVMVYGAPLADKVLLGRILGTLDSALMAVLFYYFGSSAGSAEKNRLMATMKQ